ncbi:hypothetical protein DL96DRAFT_1732902 [Flagelloscypha sp. PMI_526]|nr:hypothetical protein DL96DRAFT_1732902 [Flagelloscypha sp. PMI_526]
MFSFVKLALVIPLALNVRAQRPDSTSICDYYTTALLKDNNSTNQYTLLTLLVNTAVIGNYTSNPGSMVAVPGILNPNGTVDGKKVNLVPYFSGALSSSNVNDVATAVNWLDDGGAAPLMANKPANGTSSNQYTLLTHLYSYFGGALGCTQYGKDKFPAYSGSGSQYSVHKYMALSNAEVTYFITQVGLSAKSFGVSDADVTSVGSLLTNTFGQRCAKPAPVIPDQGNQLQSICTENDCPQADGGDCSAYAAVNEPVSSTATATSPANQASSTSGGGSSSGSPNAAVEIKPLSIFSLLATMLVACL